MLLQDVHSTQLHQLSSLIPRLVRREICAKKEMPQSEDAASSGQRILTYDDNQTSPSNARKKLPDKAVKIASSKSMDGVEVNKHESDSENKRERESGLDDHTNHDASNINDGDGITMSARRPPRLSQTVKYITLKFVHEADARGERVHFLPLNAKP
jgi:hypothetical protein